MKDNPFATGTYAVTWLKHFNPGKVAQRLPFLEGVYFVKRGFPWFYSNVGKSNTKGIYYTFKNEVATNFRKKVVLIYDIPEYFGVTTANMPEGLQLKKVGQYPGFLLDLDLYSSFEQYMGHFSKPTRYKLNKSFKRLQLSFDISYKVFYGTIEPEEYQDVFRSFRSLLEKRFAGKGVTNNNLDPAEWDFYVDVTLPMILEKKAALAVVYDGDRPIAITLNYLGDNVVFDAITVFDTDYAKFNLGYVNIMYLIDWCFQNGFTKLDFSKGYLEYKTHWSNLTYTFDYHIVYDADHLPSKLLAWAIERYFTWKQKLRQKGINERYYKLTFALSGKKKTVTRTNDYIMEMLTECPDEKGLEPLDSDSENYKRMKRGIVSFLFLSNEHSDSVRLFKEKSGDTFIVRTNQKAARFSR